MTSKREATSPAIMFNINDSLPDVNNENTSVSRCESSIKKLRLLDTDTVNNDDHSDNNSQSSLVSQDTNLSDTTSLANTPVHVDHTLLIDDVSHSTITQNPLNAPFEDVQDEYSLFSLIPSKETQTNPVITRTIQTQTNQIPTRSVETQTICSFSPLNSPNSSTDFDMIDTSTTQASPATMFTSDSDISLNNSHHYITDDELIEFFQNISD